MKLTEAKPNKAPVFRGKARSVKELIASIKGGHFTLDGRHLVVESNLDLVRSKPCYSGRGRIARTEESSFGFISVWCLLLLDVLAYDGISSQRLSSSAS